MADKKKKNQKRLTQRLKLYKLEPMQIINTLLFQYFCKTKQKADSEQNSKTPKTLFQQFWMRISAPLF